MTLSSWFREYVYIPLGGSRKGVLRQVLNLFVVWFLTGLWHGAGWNFVLWGMYFFILLSIEKFFLQKWLQKLPALFQHIYALLWIVVGWVIFACDDLNKLKNYLKMLVGVGVPACNRLALYEWTSHAAFLFILAVASFSFVTSIARKFLDKIASHTGEAISFWLKSIWCLVVLILSIAVLISSSYNPFLYFRF